MFFTFKKDGITVRPSIHSAAQAFDRRPDLEQQDWEAIHTRVVDKVKNLESGDYLFFSKSYQQAYVTEFIKHKGLLKIITVLPKNRGNPKPGTSKFFVEQKMFDYCVITVD